jgi:magnesium-transporting ATPase (P-type)
MLEAYSFLAMFTLQILAMSVLYPAWFTRYVRSRSSAIPAERLAELYPDVDVGLAQQRSLTRYRRLNTALAVLGLLLLGGLFGYMRHPDWHSGLVNVLLTGYSLLQMLVPLGLVLWLGVRFNRVHRRPLRQRKRRASLQRRALFDFVSPWVVLLAVLGYLLFVGFVLKLIQAGSIPTTAGFINIAGATLIYAVQTFIVGAVLYGKKADSSGSHAVRLRTMGLVVKSCVYSCLVCIAFVLLNLTLGVLDLQRWEPLALSVFFVSTVLISLMGMTPGQPPGVDGLDAGAGLSSA